MNRTTNRVAGLLALSALTALTACAAPDISTYQDVRAQLNFEDGTISYPLDEFALTGEDAKLVERANAILISRCMADSSLKFPRADSEWWDLAPVPDRLFGLWSAQIAEKYGYDLPPGDQALSDLEASMHDTWWDRYRECHDSSDLLPPMTPLTGDPNNPSTVDRGYRESIQNTQASAVLRDAKAAWVDCIAEQGLVAEEGPILVPVLPESKEEQFRIALLDVACKESLGTMQQVGDVLAQYQAAYIDGHDGELNEYREQALEVLAEAREILTTSE